MVHCLVLHPSSWRLKFIGSWKLDVHCKIWRLRLPELIISNHLTSFKSKSLCIVQCKRHEWMLFCFQNMTCKLWGMQNFSGTNVATNGSNDKLKLIPEKWHTPFYTARLQKCFLSVLLLLCTTILKPHSSFLFQQTVPNMYWCNLLWNALESRSMFKEEQILSFHQFIVASFKGRALRAIWCKFTKCHTQKMWCE